MTIEQKAKRSYHAPVLTVHGSMQDITAAGPNLQNGPDGGAYPNSGAGS